MRIFSRSSLPFLSFCSAVLLASGLFVGTASAGPFDGNGSVTVQMQDSDGNSVGTVKLIQLKQGILFVVDLEDLPPGAHGFHIHEHGQCEAPDFKSAGKHYNPADKEHGFDNPKGYHAGDLPNIHVASDGTVQAEFFAPQLVLNLDNATRTSGERGPYPLLDSDGSAIIIHEGQDNYTGHPGVGKRIACGVIERNNR